MKKLIIISLMALALVGCDKPSERTFIQCTDSFAKVPASFIAETTDFPESIKVNDILLTEDAETNMGGTEVYTFIKRWPVKEDEFIGRINLVHLTRNTSFNRFQSAYGWFKAGEYKTAWQAVTGDFYFGSYTDSQGMDVNFSASGSCQEFNK